MGKFRVDGRFHINRSSGTGGSVRCNGDTFSTVASNHLSSPQSDYNRDQHESHDPDNNTEDCIGGDVVGRRRLVKVARRWCHGATTVERNTRARDVIIFEWQILKCVAVTSASVVGHAERAGGVAYFSLKQLHSPRRIIRQSCTSKYGR